MTSSPPRRRPRFADRRAAGAELASRLGYVGSADVVVLAIPSGGVPVAAELARILRAPLDLIDIHEITAHRRDLGVGVVSSTDRHAVHQSSAHALGVSDGELADKTHHAQAKLAAVVGRIRAERGEEPLAGRVAVVVDDALAVTPAVAAAASHVRARGATRAVLAVPIAVEAFAEAVRSDFDDVISLERAAGRLDLDDWYGDLPPVNDDEVVAAVLDRASPGH